MTRVTKCHWYIYIVWLLAYAIIRWWIRSSAPQPIDTGCQNIPLLICHRRRTNKVLQYAPPCAILFCSYKTIKDLFAVFCLFSNAYFLRRRVRACLRVYVCSQCSSTQCHNLFSVSFAFMECLFSPNTHTQTFIRICKCIYLQYVVFYRSVKTDLSENKCCEPGHTYTHTHQRRIMNKAIPYYTCNIVSIESVRVRCGKLQNLNDSAADRLKHCCRSQPLW